MCVCVCVFPNRTTPSSGSATSEETAAGLEDESRMSVLRFGLDSSALLRWEVMDFLLKAATQASPIISAHGSIYQVFG